MILGGGSTVRHVMRLHDKTTCRMIRAYVQVACIISCGAGGCWALAHAAGPFVSLSWSESNLMMTLTGFGFGLFGMALYWFGRNVAEIIETVHRNSQNERNHY